MLKVATAKEMQRIDRVTISRHGVSGTLLMERAGLAVVSKIKEIFPDKKVMVLCGSGNNGGDGLVVARVLHNQGRDVQVFLSAKPDDLKGDARVNYKSAKKAGVKIYSLRKFLTHNASLITRHNLLIVDALLGTGLNKDVKAPLSDVIKKTNRMRCPVVSVDIPSGISSDTGQVMGCAIKANYTISFGLPKRGHLLYPGAEHTGRLFIRNIGFSQRLLRSGDIRVNLIQENDIPLLLPERPRYSHKGTYGHVLLIAGSSGKTGAAFMAAKSCLRTGAGLVTIGIPESLVNIFQSRVTEEMVLPLPDKGNGTLSYEAFNPIFSFLKQKASVLAIGPGISVDDEISRLISLLITKSSVPMVIDADGINAISGGAGVLKKSRVPLILTPHPGEMARLMSSKQSEVNSRQIEKDRINIAMTFAEKTKTCLVLKGVPTIISTPDARAFINPTGNPGMATAGTGDVLTGMISALLAQGLTPGNASILGVYMHGLVGNAVAKKKGKHSLIASDMINAIPAVFKSVLPGVLP